MAVLDWISILILGFVFGIQIIRRTEVPKWTRRIFLISVVTVFTVLAYFSYLQYAAWEKNAFTAYFLPPFNGVGYFLAYIGSRLFVYDWLISLGAAFLFYWIVYRLNIRFGERFFEIEEPRLFALGIFLTGYPGFLLYIGLMLVTGLALSIFYSLYKKGRAPFYYLWLPAAISAIIIKNYLVPGSILSHFNL